jgi:hypothetical protein
MFLKILSPSSKYSKYIHSCSHVDMLTFTLVCLFCSIVAPSTLKHISFEAISSYFRSTCVTKEFIRIVKLGYQHRIHKTLAAHSIQHWYPTPIMHNAMHTCPTYIIHGCDFITGKKNKVENLDNKFNSF